VAEEKEFLAATYRISDAKFQQIIALAGERLITRRTIYKRIKTALSRWWKCQDTDQSISTTESTMTGTVVPSSTKPWSSFTTGMHATAAANTATAMSRIWRYGAYDTSPTRLFSHTLLRCCSLFLAHNVVRRGICYKMSVRPSVALLHSWSTPKRFQISKYACIIPQNDVSNIWGQISQPWIWGFASNEFVQDR